MSSRSSMDMSCFVWIPHQSAVPKVSETNICQNRSCHTMTWGAIKGNCNTSCIQETRLHRLKEAEQILCFKLKLEEILLQSQVAKLALHVEWHQRGTFLSGEKKWWATMCLLLHFILEDLCRQWCSTWDCWAFHHCKAWHDLFPVLG